MSGRPVVAKPDLLGETEPWAALAETHSAVVVFAGERAYKFKKPVRFDFLDFSTREARERALHREVELNRRFAPDVYLGVADVIGEDGYVLDHLVVMRRMPAGRRLSALVAAGADVEPAVRDVARIMAASHAREPTNPAIAAVGTPARVATKLARDLDELRGFPEDVLPVDQVEEAAGRAHRYLAGRARLLERRVADGWIRDGHGDLLADDVFCLADGPRILDCLDFSDELRQGDVLADVAFLAMDLERLGVPGLASRFLNWYDEYSGECHPASLADYYIACRALIRAKVAAIRVGQGELTAQPEARQLLHLAIQHLCQGRIALVLVGGAPGTGKSTLADGLGARRGWVVVRSDVVRKEMAGLRPEDHASAPVGGGLYTKEATDQTYAELLGHARVALELGQSVVLDASWARADLHAVAAELANATASDLVELCCDVPPDVADARLVDRRALGRDASDADVAIARVLRERADPWPDAMVVDTSLSPTATLERALALVEAGGAPTSER